MKRLRKHSKPRSIPTPKQVNQLLLKKFGHRANLGNKKDPLDELFFVILSGQTNERLYEVAFQSLREAFPDWELLGQADPESIEKIIMRAGLAHQKSRYLVSIARRLKNDFGSVSLDCLSQYSVEQAENYLCTLPGVGIKTARCVLMYSLKRKVFPADVHCLRVMTRLGWINWRGQRAESMADLAQEAIPIHLRFRLHVNLVLLGRTVCRATPLCNQCNLRFVCPTGQRISTTVKR